MDSDNYSIHKEYSIDKDTVVILEGVFLFRKELASYVDYKVFLDISFEECKKRVKARDIKRFGKEIMEKYDKKYIPMQKKYLVEYPSNKWADIIINNSNWEFPRISYIK